MRKLLPALFIFGITTQALAAEEQKPELVATPMRLVDLINKGYEVKSGDIAVGGILVLQKDKSIAICEMRSAKMSITTKHCYMNVNY
ncbi:hypothetical protein [Magnetospirillum sp. 64-120]|uniref:hypothetical protein n=1 Tax=Magnetospirillum sp. 64-120 TaxID=1895778 RepID=UPI0025B7F476|nr:hypothetical protein [Magnetospirillum sp. 64-120]